MGCEPDELPTSILKRLPLRFNYDDNYFDHPYQAIPRDGYTAIVASILDHPKIEVRLRARYEDLIEQVSHTFYSGPLDRYYHWDLGRLGYRTLDFVPERAMGDYQGTAVINYPDEGVPFTRITEHNHFAPWEAASLDKTIVFREYSRSSGAGDIPYYPIRMAGEVRLLAQYEARAAQEKHVTFVGRLGTYQYLDMDVTIERAMSVADAWLASGAAGQP